MEKNRLEVLSGIRESIESLKGQIAELEARLVSIESEMLADDDMDLPEAVEDLGPIDISLDDDMIDNFGLTEVPSIQVNAEPVRTVEPDKVTEPVKEEENGFMMSPPAESINDKQEKKSKKAVMDVMGAKCAWKTAIPGTPVKNIISAISLNDRVLFINSLFKESPEAFQKAIAAFNGMASFSEAEEYVQQNHSDWNLNSDIVYRLMMAIRRKLK